ncbi:MAG TPA: hypothetical protein VGN11_13370 [Candidatus Baltobacteraceae bacterium]|jgi:hypothetical protein|nr:hypothetical protein [Candidatus Baltobacteraceae bacterium]
MTQRIEIGIGALFLGVGLAGMPLEPWRILLSILVCAVVSVAGGKFIAPLALALTALVGWLQHGELRVTVIAGAALLGIGARYAQSRPKAATALAAAGAIIGTGFLFLG